MDLLSVTFLESLILVVALSVDTFTAGIAYGTSHIKIPVLSALLISLISSSMLVLSSLVGSLFSSMIHPVITKLLCFIILSVIGLIKLCDGLTKNYIRSRKLSNKPIFLHFFNLKLVLQVYADPEVADQDCSKILSIPESLGIAVALSLDSLAVGIGAGLFAQSIPELFGLSMIVNFLALFSGALVGYLLSKKFRYDFSWLGGLLLIIIAFFKL